VADFFKLEKKLNIKFQDKDLLKQAFVHRSYLNENSDFKFDNNERLEFLGDAVLELSVTDYLFSHYENPEGELTSWRAALVNTKMLAKAASKLGFNDYLMLSRGESKDLGKARESILANSFEAVIGAIYLDQGYKKANEFILKNIIKELPRILKQKLYIDAKSHFQELAQEKTGFTPSYEALKQWGPDHNKKFEVGVFLDEKLIAKAIGRSKQEAQEKAARKGLQKQGWLE